MPLKIRFCNECSKKSFCDRCNYQQNENKEFQAIFKLLKQQAPNQLVHMLPYFKE